MSAPLFRQTVRGSRWTLVGYGGGLAALAMLYVALFPTFSDTLADFELPAGYSAFIGDIEDLSTASNYLQIEMFSVWVPLLVSIYAITTTTAQLAGDEQGGTLELVLSQPISRHRVMLERLAGVVMGLVTLLALGAIGFLVSMPFVELDDSIELWDPLVALAVALPFGLFLIALGSAICSATPVRSRAAGLMTVAVVTFYVFDVLPGLAEGLEPLQYASAFFYSDAKSSLIGGAELWHQAVLLVGAFVLLAIAIAQFESRDIGSTRWWPAIAGRVLGSSPSG